MPSFQALKFSLGPIPTGKFGASDCAANSPTDPALEVNGNLGFIGFYDKKRGQFFDGLGCLLGRAFPYPESSVFGWPSRLWSYRATKKGLKDHKRGRIKLRDGEFQVVGFCGLPELDVDAPLPINEPSRVDKPLRSGDLFRKRKMRATPPSGLLAKKMSSPVSLPSLVVGAAHPMTECRKAAIVNVAKLLLSRHDVIMSWRNHGVN